MSKAGDLRARPLGLDHARIEYGVKSVRAPDYDDIYYSHEDGLAETAHVFIAGNDLTARFAAWSGERRFVLAETGFGAGRNMMAAWHCFEAHAPATAGLHLFSIEKHLLQRADFWRISQQWPALAGYAERLAECWPRPIEGLHRLTLSPRVTLDLYLGDVADGLAGFCGAVDAWFLDGFAPARNPAMWSADVCRAIAACSRPNARFATYSAAGELKRALSDAGFVCKRTPGFGSKRHMLVGHLARANEDAAPTCRPRPWYSVPAPIAKPAEIAVIGAGIAGTSVAAALARRGRSVTVYDRAGIASGASGNRDGVLNLRLAVEASPRTRFDLAALAYTRSWLAELDPDRSLWQDCGVLQVARNEREAGRQKRMLANLALPRDIVIGMSAGQARQTAGTPLSSDVRGGLFFPGAGTVQPRALCHALMASPGITHAAFDVVAMQATENGWRLVLDDDSTRDVAQVVLACSDYAQELCTDLPPLLRIRGQDSCFLTNDPSVSPACVLCDTGYVTPLRNGRQSVGATYEPRADDLVERRAGHEANLLRLSSLAPDLVGALDIASAAGRASWRCTSHDRLPVVGGVADVARWQADYAALGQDASRHIDKPGALWPRLAVSVAHGSHGLLRAPLAAEMIAAALTDTPQPVTRDLVKAVHPGRWLISQIVRGTLAAPVDFG